MFNISKDVWMFLLSPLKVGLQINISAKSKILSQYIK